MTVKIISACLYHKSPDGGYCAWLDRIPCDGRHWSDGRFTGGCAEPCRFAIAKSGEGNPPIGEPGSLRPNMTSWSEFCSFVEALRNVPPRR